MLFLRRKLWRRENKQSVFWQTEISFQIRSDDTVYFFQTISESFLVSTLILTDFSFLKLYPHRVTSCGLQSKLSVSFASVFGWRYLCSIVYRNLVTITIYNYFQVVYFSILGWGKQHCISKKNQHSLIATVLHCKTLNFASDKLCANTTLGLC